MTFISRQSRERAGPGRRRKRRRRKKRGAYGLESAHLDGAGSTGGFSFAPAGAIPAAFFVAPRYAPRISQPSPGAPCPERDLQGGSPPRRHRTFSGEISPCLRWAPHLHPPPQQPLRAYGTLKQKKKGGAGAPSPSLPPSPPPPDSCYVTPPGDLRATRGPGSPVGVLAAGRSEGTRGLPIPPAGTCGLGPDHSRVTRVETYFLLHFPCGNRDTSGPGCRGSAPRSGRGQECAAALNIRG